jgi:acyl-homoserine-lactone acylase
MKRMLALIYLSTLTANVQAEDVGTTLERTGHGLVHVTAKTYKGIGYGVGYAYAQDNRCLLAYRIAQVNGRVSEQVGADKIERILAESHSMTSQLMDAMFRTYYDSKAIRAGFAKEPQAVRDLAEGYAAGFNAYLKEQPNLAA